MEYWTLQQRILSHNKLTQPGALDGYDLSDKGRYFLQTLMHMGMIIGLTLDEPDNRGVWRNLLLRSPATNLIDKEFCAQQTSPSRILLPEAPFETKALIKKSLTTGIKAPLKALHNAIKLPTLWLFGAALNKQIQFVYFILKSASSLNKGYQLGNYLAYRAIFTLARFMLRLALCCTYLFKQLVLLPLVAPDNFYCFINETFHEPQALATQAIGWSLGLYAVATSIGIHILMGNTSLMAPRPEVALCFLALSVLHRAGGAVMTFTRRQAGIFAPPNMMKRNLAIAASDAGKELIPDLLNLVLNHLGNHKTDLAIQKEITTLEEERARDMQQQEAEIAAQAGENPLARGAQLDALEQAMGFQP